MSNDVAGSNSLGDLAVGIHVKARGGVVVRDGPRPPGLHLLFSLPVESTQITKSADHRGPQNLFLSGTFFRTCVTSKMSRSRILGHLGSSTFARWIGGSRQDGAIT